MADEETTPAQTRKIPLAERMASIQEDPGLPTLEQPECTENLSEAGRSIQVTFRGSYVALKALHYAVRRGDPYETGSDYSLSESDLRRENGGIGLLVISYKRAAGADSGGDDEDAEEIRTDWSLDTVASDLSIFAFCGPSIGANANRARIEAWMAEPDAEAKSVFKYRYDPSFPPTNVLTDADQRIAQKILEGKESVRRHRPVVRKKTEHTCGNVVPNGALDRYISKIQMKNLGCPAWIADRADYWLKCDERCRLTDSGQTLEEAWEGGVAFDPDFYGPTPWETNSI